MDRDGRARQQSAAAEGRDDGIEASAIVEQLQRRRALAGDHAVVVEGMDQRRAGLRLHPAHVASRAARVGAQKRIARRGARTFACLAAGAFSGITIHAGMPRRAAA